MLRKEGVVILIICQGKVRPKVGTHVQSMMIPQAMETTRPSAPIAFMPIASPVLVMKGLLPLLLLPVAVELFAADVEVEVCPLASCKYETPSGHHKIESVKASTNSKRSAASFVPAVDGGISVCRGRWFSRNKAIHACLKLGSD